MNKIYKIEVYVPEKYCEKLKREMFNAGAGKFRNYDLCAWQTIDGIGQFRPLNGSNPFVGKAGSVEKVREIKIELVCEEKYLEKTIKAINKFHPYETPAFQYWIINNKENND